MTCRRLAVSLAAAALAAAARADNLSAVLQPSFSSSHLTTTDATGAVSHTDTDQLLQSYRLALDQTLYPQVHFLANGSLDWTKSWTTTDGVSGDTDLKRWVGYARLQAGPQILNGALEYNRDEETSQLTSLGQPVASPHLVRETYSGFASWRPADLPSLDLRLTRSDDRDVTRSQLDLVTDELLVSSIFTPTRQLDLRYNLHYTNPDDRLHGVNSQELVNSASITWSDQLLDRRLAAYASYNIGTRYDLVSASGSAGAIAAQQLPTDGYSLIEKPERGDTPFRDTLDPNPLLVDGVTDPTADTGIDLGWGPVLSGDLNYRDLGARFGGALGDVNTLYLWVNQQLPPDVAAGLAFDVYRSDDNLVWTPVAKAAPVTGGAPVQFSLIANRFEITIERTKANYLKVVAKPLLPAVTTQEAYRHIRVTELQFFLVLPPSQVARSSTVTSGALNVTGRYQILSSPSLSYDFAVFGTHSNQPAGITWSVLNGLSFARRLGSFLSANARIDRTDSDQGTGHQALTRLSAGLAADPLPTLAGGITYSGLLSQLPIGTGYTNGVSAFTRADLYPGLSLSGNAGVTYGQNELSQNTQTALYGVSALVNPHRSLTLTGAYNYSISSFGGGGRPGATISSGRLDGTVSFTPVPALFTSAGISRIVSGTLPAGSLVNYTVSVNPFPGGDLQLRFNYSETLDTTSDLKTTLWGPGVRWNIRAGAFLDVSYTWSDNRIAALDQAARTLFASLNVAL